YASGLSYSLTQVGWLTPISKRPPLNSWLPQTLSTVSERWCSAPLAIDDMRQLRAAMVELTRMPARSPLTCWSDRNPFMPMFGKDGLSRRLECGVAEGAYGDRYQIGFASGAPIYRRPAIGTEIERYGISAIR